MSSTSSAPATPSVDQPTDQPVDPATAVATPAAPAEGTEGEAAARPQPSPAETLAKLTELFPALFKGAPKPFKLRIQVDIQERAPGVFSKQALSAFFRRHTGATSYLIAVSKGTQRFDLDGQPAGEISEEHRKVAADELARRRANVQAKREQENAQREQEMAGRRQRASLLRDFEMTKLTVANFCALKGVAADQLDGLLAQARAEALEDAQRPRQQPELRHGRGHHGQQRRDEAGAGRRDTGGRSPGRNGPRAQGAAPGEGPQHPPRTGPGRGPREGGAGRAPGEGGRKEGRPPRRG